VARALAAVLLAAAMIGCGSDPEATSSTPTPRPTAEPTYAFAYRLPLATARRLADGDAYATIEQEGEVVLESEWDSSVALDVLTWALDRGIDLGAGGELERVAARVAEEQELGLLVLGRRDAGALAGEQPRGTRMREWVELVRRAAAASDARHVVVIPMLD